MDKDKTVSGIRRYDFIDALRGWAILGVILVHVGQKVPHLPGWLSNITNNGQYGVQLFFVISAFTLLASLSSRSAAEPRPILNYFIRRIFRIAPMFWAAMLFYVCFRNIGWSGPPPTIDLSQIAATFFFIHGWSIYSINSVVPGDWTIAAEMTFYIILPALFKYITSLRRAIILVFTSLVASKIIWSLTKTILMSVYHNKYSSWINGLIEDFRYCWFPNQFMIFALGFILYFVTKDALASRASEERGPAASRNDIVTAGLLIAVSLWMCVSGLNWQVRLIPVHFLFGMAFVLLAWGLSLWQAPLFVNPVTRYIGKISYSLYLTHFFAINIAALTCSAKMKMIVSNSPVAHALLLFIVSLALSAAMSTITFYLIEQPGQLLGKKIINSINKKYRKK